MAKFEKGQSGNPGGRPKALKDVEEAARCHTESAIKTLAEICNDNKQPAPARVTAATALLDRGWGKPAQALNASLQHLDKDGNPTSAPIPVVNVTIARG